MSYPHGSEGRAASTPDFIAADGKVENLGAQVGGYAPSVGSLAKKTGAIQTEFPHFGVVGLRANLAHNDARADAVRALNAGKAVLESWKDALTQTEKNYQAADKNAAATVEKNTEYADGKNNKKDLGGGSDPAGSNGAGSPGIPPFPTSNLENSKFPDPNVDTSKFPDPNLDTSKFPDSNVDAPKFPDPDLKTPEFPDPDTKTPQMPDMPKPDDLANGPGSNIPGFDRNAIEDSLSNKNGASEAETSVCRTRDRRTSRLTIRPISLMLLIRLTCPMFRRRSRISRI
ncbi:hypothetical protein ACFQX6_52890 [Streptosporangium lutulentum]